MERQEFEKKFMKIIKEKTTLRTRCENALRDYFRFIDNHKIFQYKSYEQILAGLKTLRVQPDDTTHLDSENAYGMFSPHTSLMMLKPNPAPATFIHELTHSLSSQRRESFDCEVFQKETAPEISTGVYAIHHNLFNPEYNEKEASAISRWYRRNSYLLADTKTSRPIKIEYASGFRRGWIENSEFVNLNKIYSNVKNSSDLKKYNHGQIGNNIYFDRSYSNGKSFSGITEGVTELITQLTLAYSAPDGISPAFGSYAAQTMLCAQLYSIFGETLFEGYFTNQFTPLAKKLDLNEETLSNLLKKMSDIQSPKDDKDCEDRTTLVNQIQIDFIKLFERKMLRELAKYKNDFNTQLDMRNAILSAFFDYSKTLHFGVLFEEVLNTNSEDVWNQFESSIKNCIIFGNKLLARRQKNLMWQISKKTIKVMQNQNYFQYDYIGKDTKEISLSNRLSQFEFDFTGPEDERREFDAKKFFKSDIFPGETTFMLNNGVDQTALYCSYLGEEVDKKLLKTDEERMQK